MKISTKYDLGDMVYLVTDPDQKERMVVSIEIRPNSVMYNLVCAEQNSWHYEMEMQVEKDLVKSFES